MELGKEAGEHWRGGANYHTTSPGFEVNDLGFQSRADEHSAGLNVEYVQEQPGRVFREWNIDTSLDGKWNYGGTRLGTSLDLEMSGDLLNYWSGELNYTRDFAAFDDRLTRGGPLTRLPALNNFGLNLQSDERKPWRVELGVDFESGAVGRSRSVELEFEAGIV